MKRNAVPRRKMNLFNVFPPTVFGKTKKTIFFFSLSYKRLALKICSRDEEACCCDALSLLRPFSRPPSLFEEVGFSSRALKLSRDRLGEGFNNHGSKEHTRGKPTDHSPITSNHFAPTSIHHSFPYTYCLLTRILL